jgi:2',3'-cyclic-nucleotide 2'-phosphodiesterase (5'-nucleotidase family)
MTNNMNPIKIGDFLGPSPMSAFDKGAHMITAMNLCGFTHLCVGNHEFDGIVLLHH